MFSFSCKTEHFHRQYKSIVGYDLRANLRYDELGLMEHLNPWVSGNSSVQSNQCHCIVKLIVTPCERCTHKTQILESAVIKSVSKVNHFSLSTHCSTQFLFYSNNLIEITHINSREIHFFGLNVLVVPKNVPSWPLQGYRKNP